MTDQTPEHLLSQQLATCLTAMQDCLVESRKPHEDDPYGHLRLNELDYVGRLMKASARLTLALARLRGETNQNIRVTHGRADAKDGG